MRKRKWRLIKNVQAFSVVLLLYVCLCVVSQREREKWGNDIQFFSSSFSCLFSFCWPCQFVVQISIYLFLFKGIIVRARFISISLSLLSPTHAKRILCVCTCENGALKHPSLGKKGLMYSSRYIEWLWNQVDIILRLWMRGASSLFMFTLVRKIISFYLLRLTWKYFFFFFYSVLHLNDDWFIPFTATFFNLSNSFLHDFFSQTFFQEEFWNYADWSFRYEGLIHINIKSFNQDSCLLIKKSSECLIFICLTTQEIKRMSEERTQPAVFIESHQKKKVLITFINE